MKTRKLIAALALVFLIGVVLPMTAKAQSSGLTDYEKESRETFKKQQKQAKKAGKKQFKAIQKAQKKQAKAYKKSLKEEKKHGLTL